MNIIGEKQRYQKFLREDLIILDKNVAVFSMERLKNCSIIEAIKILRYKTKYDSNFYRLYLHNIYKNAPKYLQKITIHNRWKNYVLIENIIAEYLNKKEVSFKDEWIYVGWHDWSGYRIIVGCGPAIILSRFIPKNIVEEFEKTKQYLKRLKINSPLIFSTIEDIESAKLLCLDDILNFAEKNDSIKPIFKKDRKILTCISWIIIFILSAIILSNSYEIFRQNYYPTNRNNKIQNENLSVYMTSKNYNALMQLLTNLNDNLYWNKIAEFCKQNDIKIHSLKLDHNFVKIKTKLSLKKIKALKNTKIEYSNNSHYEQLGSDQTLEAIIWLNLN